MLSYGNRNKGLRLPLIALTLLLFFVAGCDSPDSDAKRAPNTSWKREPGADLVQKYLNNMDQQRDSLRGMTMKVQLDGKLPRLKKSGTMAALRRISALGKITYKVLGFQGDDTVKKEVIARYLTAETQAEEHTGGESVSITPNNYEFKYKGVQTKADKTVHVFELKPRRKRVGLFKGELWLDKDTLLPLHEEGRLVKNPSIFLKKVEFARDYEITDGVARPKRIESVIDTRIAGKAELRIDFLDYAREPQEATVDSARNAQTAE